jgi:PAS domain S-box-containing protein
MNFVRRLLAMLPFSWSHGVGFVVFSAVLVALTVSLMTSLMSPPTVYDKAKENLSRQIFLAHTAADLARDLALAEEGRAALRRRLATIASELAAQAATNGEDLSLDTRLRVYVARLRALSKGDAARLSASDPRLIGITGAIDGSLGKALEDRRQEVADLIAASRARALQQLILLVVGAFGVVVVAGAVFVARAERRSLPQPGERNEPPETKPARLDNEALLLALEGLEQGVALFDANDSLTFFTPKLAEIFAGVLAPETGQTYEQFLRSVLAADGLNSTSAEDQGRETSLDEVLSERLGQPHGSISKDYLADGRCLEIAEYGTSVGGRIILVRDITDTEHREAVRRVDDSRTAAIVDTVFDGIIMINDEGIVETFNPAAEAIFGYPAAEVIGFNVSMLMPESHAAAHDRYLKRYLDGGPKKVIGAITELQGRRRDGQLFPLEIAVDEVDATWILQERRRTPRRVFIATVRDITGQKELARQLQQSQKMEAIGTLAGGIAHDFNNILSIILGFTGLTLEDKRIDEEGRENLETVLEAARRARDLVGQILTFSRKGEQEKLRVSLQTVLEDALKMLRSTFPANVEIRTDIDPGDLVVMADPTQVHQVLMNLCANAGQAMPGGGILEVKLQHVRIDGKSLEAYGMQGDGNCVRLMVRDTGTGMDETTLERVFEPFFTTKPLGAGTGLGLSVVHGIIHEHGGYISVESAQGAGTTFVVLLPLAESGAAVIHEQREPVPGGTGRILFVDDEAAVVRMAGKILSRLGYQVIGQQNSVDALRLFREQPDAIDLVITDHSMPDMTGDVLATELRRIRSDIPVIICTGYSATFTPEVAKQAGLDGYLLKPAMATDLGRIVHEVLATARR